MRNQHLIVTGIPACGKSTVGRSLAEALGFEMLDKDDILEELFNERGIGDLGWRTMLSRAADEILRERASRAASSVIVSWWRHPASTRASGTPIEWLSELRGELIEIHCVCSPAVAAERFKSRTRHSGHLDQFKSHGDLLPTFEQQAAMGPLGVGELVEVDTEGPVDLPGLLTRINPTPSAPRNSFEL